MHMKHVELLTAKQVERVHEASLWVLENVGILAHHPPAREVFKAHGCSVDADGLVKFPPEVVGTYMQACPTSFTFRGRDPQYDRTIPDCCLLYTSDAADDLTRVDLGGRRIIK